MINTIYDVVKHSSQLVDDYQQELGGMPRTIHSVYSAGVAEIGELGVEVNCASGFSYKDAGVDGVVGEALDTIICMLDIIHVYDSTITEQQLRELVTAKCAKWLRSEQQRLK